MLKEFFSWSSPRPLFPQLTISVGTAGPPEMSGERPSRRPRLPEYMPTRLQGISQHPVNAQDSQNLKTEYHKRMCSFNEFDGAQNREVD